MLIKEYRILLPLTVDEYRIAQLYMIQKKSRLDSHGKDSGVEIISNKPYTDGPGGSGQYTYKIYHIGSKVPMWIRTVLPTNVLDAHEEAWNAYPFTKTRYSSPMMDRLSLEVETVYLNDAGTLDNVFNLTPEELKHRVVDVMNIVTDPISSHDYCIEEDPKLYRSEKTGRGPLNDDWVEECVRNGKPIMCAYKLCKVEFRYWGMQSRVERWIHDLALRNTMLRAHRQAWAWQDEWDGLTMKDIRKLEHEAALHLSAVMASADDEVVDDDSDDASDDMYFDCDDGYPEGSKKPSIIRWSSEIDLMNDDNSPPLTPHKSAAALLIFLFHGDFSPENPADSKTTDSNTFKSTIENLVQRHYPQLRDKVHMVMVSCGSELSSTVSRLTAISPSFGVLHPSLSLLVSSAPHLYNEAVEGTIRRANETFNDFLEVQPNFNGEVFVVGDAVGGLFLYEAMTRHETLLCRLPSNRSTTTDRPIPEAFEEELMQSVSSMPTSSTVDHLPDTNGFRRSAASGKNYSAPPSASWKKVSLGACSVDSNNFVSRLNFHPTTAFLLGCPLGLVLTQKKLSGTEFDPLDSCQLFNLYYPLDPCGARIEPVLNSQLVILPPANVPKYQRYPLGDGKNLQYDSSIDTSLLWGGKRIDQVLYCPNAMVSLPSSALPNILHASYWESSDVAAFILRQFVRSEEAVLTTLSASMNNIPFDIQLPTLHWKKRRTRFKVANLSANHRANDVLVVSGGDQVIHAKFCYGPMDLVALTRELVTVYVCPQRGEWFEQGIYETDSHGRLTVSLSKMLPCGIHCIKMVVHGDHSYLDAFLAVVPRDTPCVVFSVDGSLTASVSVTGKDPRVRPGAVDVVRYWHDSGYLIVYTTARPDMQQRVVSSWLAQHNFPHALLFFNQSFSTDPLRQKSLHLKHLLDMGVKIHAAYGSSKDITVYSGAGIEADRIVSVAGGRRKNCLCIENYSSHLVELTSGESQLAQPLEKNDDRSNSFHRNVSRTASFTPRGGKLDCR